MRFHRLLSVTSHARLAAIIIIPLLCTGLLATGAPAQHTAIAVSSPRLFPPDSAVLAILKQRVDEKRSAGIVVGLIDGRGHTRVVAYGDPGPGQPALDGNSVFEIGSISKVFTSTVLAELVNEGRVRLDDPVQKYLPASVRMPVRNGKQITLGNLAEQNSGLPRLPSNLHPKDMSNPYADYTVPMLYEFLSGYQLTRDPGEKFEYSNLGVGLLGDALALATGQSYEALQRTRVWKPLGMTRSGITLSPWMKNHLALGHDAGKVVSNWDLPALAGAGAIRSTAFDMLKFVGANLRPDAKALGRAMSLAQRERAPAGNPKMSIGLNWLTLHTGSDTIVWHNGGTGGYSAFIGFEPSRKIGVVVLTNSGGAGASPDDIGMHLLNPALPLTTAPKIHTAIDLPPNALMPYVGTYELAPGFLLDITINGGVLYMHPTAQPTLRLWPETEKDFFLKEVDAQVTFVRDANGIVSGLVLHQNGQNPQAKKVK